MIRRYLARRMWRRAPLWVRLARFQIVATTQSTGRRLG